jgi:membrane protease YdiL (CAAX protease family)
MQDREAGVTRPGQWLLTSRLAGVVEILAVFGVGVVVITVGAPRVGDNPLARGGVVWVANILMLATVWLGLRLRGQGWRHFGLTLSPARPRAVLRAFVTSLAVFVAALGSFVVGAIAMGMILGRPEAADLSGYDALRGNLPLLLLVLALVYVSSSFGEEVTYRGFLITRIAELGSGGRGAWRIGVLISSVVFGLIHFSWGPAGMVQTGVMGLALGLCYLAIGRRLWPLILAHAYLDSILLVQVFQAPPPV